MGSLDKFYTKKEIADSFLSKIQEILKIEKTDIVIEPSAGDGSFIDGVEKLSDNPLFYDIKPENSKITEQDYLKLDYSSLKNKRIHVIGNPPFGRQSSLAIKFIKFSSLFCNTISFILPKSFKKDSMKSKIPINFHLLYEEDLPKNSFLLDGELHDVPCVFQIWEKRDNNRDIPKKLFPKGYNFVKKTEDHDISFRRVGGTSGTIDVLTENKNTESHYFIKFDSKPSEKLLENIRNLKFSSRDMTVGPRSISKQEIIKEFNSLV